MVHPQQHFIGDMNDMKPGVGGPGDIDCLGEGATRGFAVVYGDDDLLVHGW
jgi:hypothetical protein